MKSNLHTHTTFCDGKNSVEENVISAIEKGFVSLGFSGHGYTDFDKRFCMKDVEGYINQVNAAREKYKDKIQIYLGVEEDMHTFVDRKKFDYIIGSNHYYVIDDKYYDVDATADVTEECLRLLEGNEVKLAQIYFQGYCDYLVKRKPDIAAHFDLLTKFDEKYTPFFSDSEQYRKIAREYLLYAMKSGCIFEVNTGAIARGYRKTPYPSIDLLYTLLKNDGKIMLNSDCHSAEKLDFAFDETILLLKDIGFTHSYTLYDGKFNKVEL